MAKKKYKRQPLQILGRYQRRHPNVIRAIQGFDRGVIIGSVATIGPASVLLTPAIGIPVAVLGSGTIGAMLNIKRKRRSR